MAGTVLTTLLRFHAVATIAISLCSPLTAGVLSTYGAMALAIVIGGLATLFLLVPVYLFLEKNVRVKISINSEKRKQINYIFI